MNSNHLVDEMIPYIENLKISAFRKAKLIRNEVHEVTIGPNSAYHKQKNLDSTEPCNKNCSNEIVEETCAVNTSEEILPIRQVAKEYEIERHRQVQKAIEGHTKKFELFDVEQNIIRKQQWLLHQQKFIRNMQHQEREINRALKEYEDNKSSDNEKLMCFYKQLEDGRQKSAALLEAKKRKTELLKQCVDNQGIFQSIYHEIMMNIKNCQDEKLKLGLAHIWKQIKELNDLMIALISKCKTMANISDEEKKTTDSIVSRANEMKICVAQILLKNQNSNKKENVVSNVSSSKSLIVQNSPSIIPPVTVDKIQSPPSNDTSLDKYVSKSNFKWYSEIIDFHEKYSQSFKQMLSDENCKQFKFDCRKAVNLTVNAISAVNPQHLNDKYIKLSNLLLGKNVVIGDFQVRATQHPAGIQFCTDLLAKKFVLQGDMMISSNPEAAFSFATIIISLWNEHPDFGKLLLAYFFKECPYLVPFYIPRAVEQTDQDFYESQGYKYVDGQVEKQDKFLKRMTGIMRLYFAILISHPKRDQNKHPHNIKAAWTWFVSVLKLQPRIDITATMVHTFLETLGFELQNTYRTQFLKLLKCFLDKYFPSLKNIDNGGPVTRLECLIQELGKNRYRFKMPAGVLSNNFW